MFKYIWFISVGGTLWCKTINIRGIMLVGFSLHGEHGKDNPNKPWSLSCKASDYRGLGEWHACFFGIKFLGSRVREYKACLRLLKIWHGHGLQKTCITSGKSNQVKRLMSILYIPGLSESQQSGPCPPCCSEPRQWHARAFCPPWEEYKLSDLRTHAGGEGYD